MDDISYLRIIFALGAVLGLIGLITVLLRRYGVGGAPALRSNIKRLAIDESRMLDARNRLVLIRRDNVQHLLVIGPGNCTVVETGITPITSSKPSPHEAEIILHPTTHTIDNTKRNG